MPAFGKLHRGRKRNTLNKTVAIIGSHPATRNFDFTRRDVDIWVFNEAVKTPTNTGFAERADLVFQLHDPVIWRNPGNRNDPGHYDWLKSGNTPPVVMQKKYEDVPNSLELPKDDILKLFGTMKPYVTSSIAWAILYAVHLGYESIIIRGVELETETEYTYQQPAFALAVGVALGRGIKIDTVAKMFDFPLYGFEGDIKLKREQFQERADLLKQQLDANEETLKISGQNLQVATSRFIQGGAADELHKILKAHLELGTQQEATNGAYQENVRYLGKADAMIAEAGDFIFSRQEFEGALQGAGRAHQDSINKANVMAGHLQKAMTDLAKEKKQHKRLKKSQEFIGVMNEYIKFVLYSALYNGAGAENKHLLGVLDKHIKAAGGAKSEAVMLEKMGVK